MDFVCSGFSARTLSRTRRGVILLVVVGLLTLFAVVGLSFVLYADAQARMAQFSRQAEAAAPGDLEPEKLLAYFLGQLLFDLPDDASGVDSALRGHSLARSMYGYNDAEDAVNNLPWNGTGRLHTGPGRPGAPAAGDGYNNPFDVSDYYLINYTFFRQDGFLRDPERLRPPGPTGWRTDPAEQRGPWVGGFNVSYTYPDLNNLFLAAVRPGDGKLLIPSYHRPWLFGPVRDIPGQPPGNPGNPNWTNALGKYLLLRPRPADRGAGFPYPEDENGDVKNLINLPGGNDSFWLDLGFPVCTSPAGQRYKPLFAPLILDLDGRVNLNVHGNRHGRDPGNGQRAHVSHQGWGPWEVNLGHVLSHGSEYVSLFEGLPAPPQPGRYGLGPAAQPGNGGETMTAFPPVPLYSQLDFDACQLRTRLPSQPFLLPGHADNPHPAYLGFPYFPPLSFGNANGVERTDHPGLYSPVRPVGDDRSFSLSNLEALLRYGDTGSPALTSELFRLCPTNLAEGRVRRQVTTHSADLDRPGVQPYVWAAGVQSFPYTLPGDGPPRGRFIPFPRPGTPLTRGEFSSDWRAVTAALGRLDLNRKLPDYPAPDASGRIRTPAALQQFQTAQVARQQLAEDVYRRLVAVTGAFDPETLREGQVVPLAEIEALRWLAQLAANIVDFLDGDDVLTPFEWRLIGSDEFRRRFDRVGWVFGTELPRVVLNEVYIEHDESSPRTFKVWVELHNPLSPDPTRADNGAARLSMPDDGSGRHGVYEVVVTKPDPAFHAPDNVTGEPLASDVLCRLSTFVPAGAVYPLPPVPYPAVPPGAPHPDPDPRYLLPANGAVDVSLPNLGTNRGYYLLGPEALPGTSAARPRLTLTRPELRYSDNTLQPSLLLRRLACPYLPPQALLPPPPDKPYYNPYVTIDALFDIPVNRSSLYVEQRVSYGRRQPYTAHRSQQSRQLLAPLQPEQPQHTFFRVNQPHRAPFTWLVHLDRPLSSPAELLHVSACKPHELTQRLRTDSGTFQHVAPWYDQGLPPGQSARLYRLFELLGTAPRTAGLGPLTLTTQANAVSAGRGRTVRPITLTGTTPAGAPWQIRPGDVVILDQGQPTEENVRVAAVAGDSFTADFLKDHAAGFTLTLTTLGDRLPGKINLNTLWDSDQGASGHPEIFRALCDPQPANHFTANDVRAIYRAMLRQRTPGLLDGTDRLTEHDRPLRGLATGRYPPTDPPFPVPAPPDQGLEDTLLRGLPQADDPDRRLFQVGSPEQHPYVRNELLTKIFNQVTTRSNVFAVWLTVGFFEVTDASSQPVQLGAELGRAENRQRRHRLFAVVDRSVLAANPGPQLQFDPRGSAAVLYFSIID